VIIGHLIKVHSTASCNKAGFDNVQDVSAADVVKPTLKGEMRQFTVFLIIGQKRLIR
jgi:hypothetical protein